MSSYHQAIARQVFLEKFQALLHSIHQEEAQTSAINQYIKNYLKLDGDSENLGTQIVAYLQQNAKLQRHLVSAQQFGLAWKRKEISEQAKISYVQLSIVAIVFEAIAQTEASLFDEKYGLTIKEIEPLKQALLKDFIKTIMPENRASTTTEGKLLGGIEAKIEEVLPLVKEEAVEQAKLKQLAKEETMSRKAEIEPPKEAKKPAPKSKAASASVNSNTTDWARIGFWSTVVVGSAIIVGAALSRGNGPG